MNAIYLFDSADEARAYRTVHGTGGWVFAATDDLSPRAILFPHAAPVPATTPASAPTPSWVMNHPITRGRSGVLC